MPYDNYTDFWDANAVDQLTRERGQCMMKNCDVRKYYLELKACQERVMGKTFTAETCHQETVDLVEAVDHCVHDKAFLRLH